MTFTIGQKVASQGIGGMAPGVIVKVGRPTKIASDRKYLVRYGTGEYWKRQYELREVPDAATV